MKNIWGDEAEVKDLKNNVHDALTSEMRQVLEAILKVQLKRQGKNNYKYTDYYLNTKVDY